MFIRGYVDESSTFHMVVTMQASTHVNSKGATDRGASSLAVHSCTCAGGCGGRSDMPKGERKLKLVLHADSTHKSSTTIDVHRDPPLPAASRPVARSKPSLPATPLPTRQP